MWPFAYRWPLVLWSLFFRACLTSSSALLARLLERLSRTVLEVYLSRVSGNLTALAVALLPALHSISQLWNHLREQFLILRDHGLGYQGWFSRSSG